MRLNASIDSVDISFALTGDPKNNSRALRQLSLLSDLGLQILVLGLGQRSGISDIDIRNVHLQYLPRPVGSGPRFFWKVHQQFMSALQHVTSKIYHASDLYTLPAMFRAAKQRKAHLVFDSRELYPHVPATINRPWVRGTWAFILRRYAQHANCIFTVSESIAQHLGKYYRLENIHVMHNVPGPQIETQNHSIRTRLDVPPEMKILLHQGTLQRDRGIQLMIKSMHNVDDAILVFMGAGPLKSESERLVNHLNLASKVRFLDPVPPNQLLSVTASADLGLTFLEDCCLNHRYALPNKLFEYLAAGVPVITSNLPEISQIIERFNVGCVVPSGDPKALGSTLNHVIRDEELRKQWSSNTSRVQELYNYATESKRFITPYRDILNQ